MHSKKRLATGLGGKAIKGLKERQRRDQGELAAELHGRAQRQSIPRRDDGPPPRID